MITIAFFCDICAGSINFLFRYSPFFYIQLQTKKEGSESSLIWDRQLAIVAHRHYRRRHDA